MRVHGERLALLAASEHLDPALAARHDAVFPQQIRRNGRTRVELQAQRVEVHHVIFHAERVVEPALGHAAVQRHLTAFEATLELEARTRFRALVSASRGLAVARSLAAADPLLRMLHPPRGLQIAETHINVPCNWRIGEFENW